MGAVRLVHEDQRSYFTSSGLCLALAQARAPSELSFSGFSNLVSRDGRIPPASQTKVGTALAPDESVEAGALVWPISRAYMNTQGCALVPAMTDGKNWLKGVYRFGFQGRAPETRGFLSGMHVDLHTGSGGEVLIVASGRTVGRDALNGSIDAFLSHTGLAPFAVDGKMRADLDAKQSDIAQIYGENPFLERGLYMCAPLIYKGIGVYSVKTEIVPLG